MRRPGLEPGPPPWQGGILPLDYRRVIRLDYLIIYKINGYILFYQQTNLVENGQIQS